MDKPDSMEEGLYNALQKTFPDRKEFEEVVTFLTTKRVFTQARAQRQGVGGLTVLGLDPVLAGDVIHAVGGPIGASTGMPPVDEPPARGDGLDRLADAFSRALGGRPVPLETLPLAELLTRLIESAGADSDLIEFADTRHPKISRMGVVLTGGAQKTIYRDETISYLAQARSYLGEKWKGYKVGRVADAFGVKEMHNPFNLEEPLQDGTSPSSELELGEFKNKPALLNLFAWIAENKPLLVTDGGFALVEVVSARDVEGLRAHRRFGKAIREYEEACGEDPATATRYLKDIFRAPTTPTTPTAPEGRRGPPFGSSPAPASGAPSKTPFLDDTTPIDLVLPSGRALGAIHEAFLLAFPERAWLERLVQFELDINLSHVASGVDYAGVVYALIGWARAEGRLKQLVEAAVKTSPGNPALQRLHARANPAPAPAPALTMLDKGSGEYFIEVRRALVRGYPSEKDARRIVAEIGIKGDSFDFQGSATSMWHTVLTEIQNHGKLQDVVTLLRREYPNLARGL